MSADWFVQGALAKLGDIFDRLTGRGWRPSSSLATSELAERLKALVDSEVRETGKRKYVPHKIALKMQWDKFSTDSDDGLKKLEHQLLTSLIDHINDRRYYTYGPITLAVKPDYFTNGVKLFASFSEADEEEREVSLDVIAPDSKIDAPKTVDAPANTPAALRAVARFAIAGREFEKAFELQSGERISIGRTRENDLALDDASVSKLHASILLSISGEVLVADTGSTNGTFIDGERIAYGKGNTFSPGQKLRFGSIYVELDVIQRTLPATADGQAEPVEPVKDDTYRLGEFEFTRKLDEEYEGQAGTGNAPAPTLPAFQAPELTILKPLNIDKPVTDSGNGGEAETSNKE
ncbi:MAG: FHA domain-containing protein [Pyrinomonadaceae bacterium]